MRCHDDKSCRLFTSGYMYNLQFTTMYVHTYQIPIVNVYTSIHVVSDCRCVLGALSRGGNCVVLWWIRVICISPWLQAQKWIGISGWGHRLFYAQTELIPSKGNFLSWLGTKSDAQNSLWLKRNNGLINRALKYAFQPRQHKIAQFQMVLVFSFLEKVLLSTSRTRVYSVHLLSKISNKDYFSRLPGSKT